MLSIPIFSRNYECKLPGNSFIHSVPLPKSRHSLSKNVTRRKTFFFICSKDYQSSFNQSYVQNQNIFSNLLLGMPWFRRDREKNLIYKEQSEYNYIRVFEFSSHSTHELAGCRTLLLDRKGNVHSVYWPNDSNKNISTNSYYDFVSFLPQISPDGPLCILGLAGGTAARILLNFYPHLEIHGWEIDPAVVNVSRRFFNLTQLETSPNSSVPTLESGSGEKDWSMANSSAPKSSLPPKRGSKINEVKIPMNKGGLFVHIEDALLMDETVESQSIASIFIDLYSKGIVIPPLQNARVWERMKKVMKTEGKMLVNCGGGCVEADRALGQDGEMAMKKTLEAMDRVFPGKVFCKRLEGWNGNVMALVGDFPDMDHLRKCLPQCPAHAFTDWFSYQEFMKSWIT